MSRWVGIDQGYSHLDVAIVEAAGPALRSTSTTEPAGNGHDREVALQRLSLLLDRLPDLRDAPVRLAGYCYSQSGVCELFAERGWTVEGTVGLNDVVGIYGLTEMTGHVVVAGCGSWPQVVYMDRRNNVRWAGGDAAQALPEARLYGHAYAQFLQEAGLAPDLAADDLPGAGRRLDALMDRPEPSAYIRKGAEAARQTRDLFWRFSGQDEPPAVVFGGGAVRGERIWAALREELSRLGIAAVRVTGDHAVGLTRFAIANPAADPWGFVGNKRPDWLE